MYVPEVRAMVFTGAFGPANSITYDLQVVTKKDCDFKMISNSLLFLDALTNAAVKTRKESIINLKTV